jgi:hypothetical protein
VRPGLPDDDVSQYQDVLSRLRRLENGLGSGRIFDLASVTRVDLGPFEGDLVTGVRITIAGYVDTSPAANTFMRLQPNGLSSLSGLGLMINRQLWDGTSHTQGLLFGGALSTSVGFAVAATDWSVTRCGLWAEGVFYTSRVGGVGARKWSGSYDNQDYVTTRSRRVNGQVEGTWDDPSTPVTSIVLAMDDGTFTGRVHAEVVV